jgi:putative phosphoserine phosphatase/1-acylglycerol-3-phosphate O-acyltransferase
MRLAHESRAPVIPIGLWGTEHVWPRSSRLPNVLNIFDPPLVTVRVGKPVQLDYDDLDADTARMMSAISALLPPEAHEWREPTAEELARTLPPGATPDDVDEDHEAARRPGTD